MCKIAAIVILACVAAGAATAQTKPNNAADRLRYDPAANEAAKKRWAELDHQEQAYNIKLDWSGRKGGFGTVFIATFTMKNGNDFDIKDPVISCEQTGPSGTTISKTTQTIYRIVRAKSSTIAKNINMGIMHPQSARASCRVIDFKRP